MAKPKYTKEQFDAEYPDDAACLLAIMEMRYGGTDIECPGCKKRSKFHPMGKRRGFSCQWCGHHIFPCANTIFEKSKTPLKKWFYAAFLLTATRHGVPARELERQLGVTYKCAWRMAHELRKLMNAADFKGPMGGPGKHLEADETLIGGKVQGRGKASFANKTIVAGIVERDGIVRAGPVPDETTKSLTGGVVQNVKPGSLISTDEHPSYRELRRAGYLHRTIKHGDKEYVRGPVHVNTIEGYWLRLKNSIKGTHVHVSKQHLAKYVGEFSYRYNMRKHPEEMLNRMILALSLPRPRDV